MAHSNKNDRELNPVTDQCFFEFNHTHLHVAAPGGGVTPDFKWQGWLNIVFIYN